MNFLLSNPDRLTGGGWHPSSLVPWVDLGVLLPWLGEEPHLVEEEDYSRLRKALLEKGFLLAEVGLEHEVSQKVYAGVVLEAMGIWEGGEANWALFNDRLWDFYSSGGAAVAVIVRGADVWFKCNFREALRCIYKHLEIVNGLHPFGDSSQRQIASFFIGAWR